MKATGPLAAVIALGLVAGGVGGDAGAQEAPDVLQGLHEVYARVDYVSEIVTDTGMKENDLLIELADRLRDAGLLVLSASDDEASGPLLVLTMEAVELPSGDVALHAALELREPVNLVRMPGVSLLGSTWYSSAMSAAPHEGVADETRGLVAKLADDFIGDLPGAAAP